MNKKNTRLNNKKRAALSNKKQTVLLDKVWGKYKRIISGAICAVFIWVLYLLRKDHVSFSIVILFTGSFFTLFIETFFSKTSLENIIHETVQKTESDIKAIISPYFNRIFGSRELMLKEHSFKDFLENGEQKVTIICLSGKNLTELKDDIRKALTKKDVDIFILRSDGCFAKARSDALAAHGTDVVMQINTTIKAFEVFVPTPAVKKAEKCLRIYKYDVIPYFSGIIIGDDDSDEKEYYITHHLFYKNAKDCPSFHIKKGDSLYTTYRESLDEFFKNNRIRDNKLIDSKDKKVKS
jgi:hypothetical protein